jgi:hypothetical protein
MNCQAHHGSMYIAPHVISNLTRHATIGARAGDPVLHPRRRTTRRRRAVPHV